MLARSVFTPPFRKATVTSSSSRVSLLVTTTPSPKRAWETRSPSRNRRSPGTRTRGAEAAWAGAAPGRMLWVPDGADGAVRRTGRSSANAASGWSSSVPDASPNERRPGTVSDPDGAPASNAVRRAARSRLGTKGWPFAGAPGRPLPAR